jgi:hypothetical protein
VVTLLVVASPLLIAGTLAEPWLKSVMPRDERPRDEKARRLSEFATSHPNVESPARIGAGIGEAIAGLVLWGLLIWSLIGLGLFIGRLSLARFVLVALYGGVLLLSGLILSHQPSVSFFVSALISGALLAYFLFSKELKTALAR